MPAGEVCQDGFLESWKSVRVGEVLGHLVWAFIPHVVGSHGCAGEDMGGGLRAATAGAMIIILVLPCEQSGANSAIGRGMLSNPSPTTRLEGPHASGAGFPIHHILGSFRDAVVAYPPHLSGLVSQQGVKGIAAGGNNFVRATPDGPSFIVNRDVWGRGELHFGVDAGPVLLGKCIHFTVEGGKVAV